MKKRTKTVKMTFEVCVPMEIMIDDDSLKREFKGDIHRVAKYLYKNEGDWWSEKMKLIKTEII